MTVDVPLIVRLDGVLPSIAGIGIRTWRSTRNIDEYVLGGRSLGRLVPRSRASRLTRAAGG